MSTVVRIKKNGIETWKISQQLVHKSWRAERDGSRKYLIVGGFGGFCCLGT